MPNLTNQVYTFNTNDWLNIDSYDANGNTTGSGGKTYSYDAMNRLTNVNNSIFIVYDGDGNRVSKRVGSTTTFYLLDDRNPSGYVQVLEEWTVTASATNLAKVYNYGSDLISQRVPNSSTNYFIYDGHGSTRALTDNAGTVKNVFTYDAYGTLIASNTTAQTLYLYSGQQFDPDLGQYYLRARTYNQGTGRFWTMDTSEGNNNDPVSLHKYLFCRDEPSDRLDPSGFDDISDTIDAAGAFDGLDLGQLAALKHQVQIRTTIALRSSAYQSYDYELNTESGAIPSRWFRAAQIVTGRFGVGAADPNSANFGLLRADTSEYLRDVNQLLFIWNTANFYKLSDGWSMTIILRHR